MRPFIFSSLDGFGRRSGLSLSLTFKAFFEQLTNGNGTIWSVGGMLQNYNR